MHCYIYKSLKKADTYLYVAKQDEFIPVPQQLMDMLGKLEFVMDLDLSETKRLAQAEPSQVIRLIQEQGYFLQIPPRIEAVQ